MSRVARCLVDLVTSDRVFLLAVACLAVHLGTKSPIADPDLGWHLKGGEHVWRHWWPPTADEFAYTIEGQPWIAYSWLAELVFWMAASRVGFHALIVLCAALVAAAFVVVYRTCREAGATAAAAYGATTLGVIATASYVSQRPGMASFLLAAIFWRAVLRHRRGEPVRLWLLPVLLIVWANVHVLFFVGIAWLWAAALWGAAEATLGRTPARAGSWHALALTAAAATVAPMVNPYGLTLLQHVHDLTSQPATLGVITEFASPDFHGAGILVLPLLLALLGALGWATERPDPFVLAVVTLQAGLALYMQRNVPFLAIVAAPMLARAATVAAGTQPTVPARLGRTHVAAHAMCAAAFVALAASALPTRSGFDANVRPEAFPVDAVRFLRTQPPLGRMMNGYNWGGYLIYTLHPRYHVSIDSRSGAYGEAYTLDYLNAHFARDGWQTYLARLAPDFVLWERGGALATALAASPDWARVYADDVAVIFVRADHPLRAMLEHATAAAGRTEA